MALKFKYKARDTSSWDKRANQQGGDWKGIIHSDYKTYNPPKGDNYVRILPPTWEDPEHYGLEVYVHFSIGADNASVLCLNKMANKKCPICEAKQRAERAGDEETSRELSANKRVVVWMLNRKDESQGPMLWSMPWTLDRDFVKVAKDRATGEYYQIDDPEAGYDISFEKTGEALLTKYIGVQVARKPSSVDQDIIDFVVSEPIPHTLVWMTYDEIKVLYEGGTSDEEEAPAKPAARPAVKSTNGAAPNGAVRPRIQPRAAKVAEPEPEEEEVEEEAEEEVEEEVEAEPVRAAPAKRPAPRAEAQVDPAVAAKQRADELRARFKNR
jgi:hypothetical protein